ncbi:MFS transporter [Odoribacter sp. OttesenSCG-928-L07]|nr:MFS transporter [Odoribacter sp. OttesenSCG-928-L07]MDL2239358.1 MFS transporter [Bacteroidales bacterium OttesenSCG-928-L14]MDL2240573.1 MFS transporter [Bacteroidales bacterium OttesenSCG-928-K22]
MKNSLSVFAVFLVFLAMGFGDAAGQLVSIIEKAFNVTPFTASLVSFSGMIMFGVLSVPMGVQQSRIGKKKMLIIGLLFFLLGAILPIVAFTFPTILVAVLLMGAGATILQVSGNPLMRDVSSPGKYSSNLSFAQAVKAIGTLSTSLIILIAGTSLMKYGWFTLQGENGEVMNIGFRILFPIFACVLLLTLILVIIFVPNATKQDIEKPTTVGKCLKTLGNPYILAMFLGIFFYCGAEASMFNRIPSIFEHSPEIAASGNIVFIVALFVGRLLGGVILRYMKPKNFLYMTIAISILGNLMLFLPYNNISTWVSFSLIGIGFANIFPLIFSMCIERYPDKSNEISGLMTTAIVGAAFVPLLTGLVANYDSKLAFLIPLACLIYLTFVALVNRKPVKS